MQTLIILFVCLVLCLGGALAVFWWVKKKITRLSADLVERIVTYIGQKVVHAPKTQQILEYHKILDTLLGQLGYRGSFSQKLQKYQRVIGDAEHLWSANRARNKITHEIGYEPPHAEVTRHVLALEREVSRILKKHQ